MYRPLSEDEKKSILREAAINVLRERRRREPELKQLRETAHAMFGALVTAPTLHIQEAPLPAWMKTPPAEPELWSVKPKVTSE